MKIRNKKWLKFWMVAVLILVTGLIANPKKTGIGWLDGVVGKMKINMGLDLQGGAHLVYRADMKNIEKGKESEALSGIQDVIERRINAFGVAEPIVQPSKIGDDYRLIVEIAGVKDINKAKEMIKETPFLEFKEEGEEKKSEDDLDQEQKKFIGEYVENIENRNEENKKKAEEVFEKALAGENFEELAKSNSEDPGSKEKGGDLDFFKKGVMVPAFEEAVFSDKAGKGEVYPELVKSQFGYHIIKKTDERGDGEEKEVRASHILFKSTDPNEMKKMMVEQMLQPNFEPTGLTGKELKKAQVDFDPQTGAPVVILQFDGEGTELFKEITERNKGKKVAMFLDDRMISAPVVNDVIRNGEAVISGKFKLKEAKKLAQNLNAGALPVPITLVSQQSVEASLGQESLMKSLKAGMWGLIAVAIFMIIYYRLAGLVSVVALTTYTFLMVSVFKTSSLSSSFTMTLTLAGIAGFILSIGMAVDANILIFERMKEEVRRGRDLRAALDEAYRRAWTSIRDGNFSTILTSFILMTFGSGFIKGFAITLAIGVLLSMFTAIVITKVLLRVVLCDWFEKRKFLVIVGGK